MCIPRIDKLLERKVWKSGLPSSKDNVPKFISLSQKKQELNNIRIQQDVLTGIEFSFVDGFQVVCLFRPKCH